MLKPQDFLYFKYWFFYEWREWNPFALLRKLKRFASNVIAYREILWYDSNCDYADLLEIMELKLARMGKHFEDHGSLVDSKKVARECRVASSLCRRINEDNYLRGDIISRAAIMEERNRRQADLDYLTHLMGRRLFTWWD